MLNTRSIVDAKLILVCTTALMMSACESSGSYRVASVGSVPSEESASASSGNGDGSGSNSNGGAASSGAGDTTGSGASGSSGSGSAGTGGTQGALGSRVLVTAGNTVIGAAGRQAALTNRVNGKAPILTPVTATVTRVLTKSGQTLVDLGQGQSLILAGKGKLGEVVKIDLGSKTVIGAANGSSLLGAGVLSPLPATGKLAAVNVGNAGPVVAVGGTPVAAGVTGKVGSVLAPVVQGVTTPTASGGLIAGASGALGLATPGGTKVGAATGAVLGIGKK